MTPNEEVANPESLLAPAGQISDEDLEAVTGGLTRPLRPGRNYLRGFDRATDAGHDDTSNDQH